MPLETSLSTISDPSQDKKENQELAHPLPPTLEPFMVEVTDRSFTHILQEYQMTVQPKVQLKQKDASLLLAVCNYEALVYGVDITLYLTMEWLFNFLLKGYKEPLEYPYEKGKQGLLLTELILMEIRGLWLSMEGREAIPLDLQDLIFSTGWVPSKSTYASWSQYHSPRKYFKVRAVRLDTFLENERNYERYSSYTKGYGEGGKLSRVQRTPFSSELDGEVPGEDSKWNFSLLEVSKYNDILTQIEKRRFGKNKEQGEN